MGWPNRTASYDYPGVNYIHPLKQKNVELLIEEAKKHPSIRYVIVFGSSTEERCTPYSDIDVMLSGAFHIRFIPPDCDVFDILHAECTPYDAAIWDEILRDGVLVYDARTTDESKK